MPKVVNKYINPKLCFKQAIPNLNITLSMSFEKAQEQFKNTLLETKIAKNAFDEGFREHFAKENDYKAKESLKDHLNQVYHYLFKNKNPDEKESIIMKLKEGIGMCTPGFHNRVNEILLGIKYPSSLPELLTKLRMDLVDSAARQYDNYVHSYNDFFKTARNLGYGVYTNYKDPYRGEVSWGKRKNVINNVFKNHYTPIQITHALVESIKGQLITFIAYSGFREEGYDYADYNKGLRLLAEYVSEKGKEIKELSVVDYCIVTEDYKVLDFNWKKITSLVLNSLSEQLFFDISKPILKAFDSLLISGQYNDSNKPSLGPLILNSSDYFTIQGYINEPKSQKVFLKRYLLESEESLTDSSLKKLNEIFNETKNNLDQQLFIYRFFVQNPNFISEYFLIGSLNSRDESFDHLLTIFSQLEQKYQHVILKKLDNADISLFALLHDAEPNLIRQIIDIYKSMGTKLLQKGLIKSYDDYDNILSVSLLEGNEKLFNEILSLIKAFDRNSRAIILGQVNTLLVNSAHWAWAYEPLLMTIKGLKANDVFNILKQEIIGNSGKFEHIIHRQAYFLALYLNAMSSLSKNRQRSLLPYSDSYNYSHLIESLLYYPMSLDNIFSIILSYDETEKKSIIKKASKMIQENLMKLIRSNGNAAIKCMKFLYDWRAETLAIISLPKHKTIEKLCPKNYLLKSYLLLLKTKKKINAWLNKKSSSVAKEDIKTLESLLTKLKSSIDIFEPKSSGSFKQFENRCLNVINECRTIIEKYPRWKKRLNKLESRISQISSKAYRSFFTEDKSEEKKSSSTDLGNKINNSKTT